MTETIRTTIMSDALTKIMLAMVMGGIGWLATTVQALDVKTAVIQQQVMTATSDRYTGNQAKSDLALIGQLIAQNTVEINEIKKQIERLAE